MREELRAFFNEKASVWDSLQKVSPQRIRNLLEPLPVAKGGSILDVGSGTGVLIPFLRELFSPSLIVELDIAEEMLKIAKEKFDDDGIIYVWGDAESFVFDKTFDAIICYSSFPHFSDKERVVVHLSNFLKKGGVFAILHSSGREAIHRIHASNEVTREDLLPPASEVALIFKKAGLEIIRSVDDDDEYALVGVKG